MLRAGRGGGFQALGQEFVEAQQIVVAELLTAGQVEVALQQGAPLRRSPAQPRQQHIGASQEVGAAQGQGGLGRIHPRLQPPQGAEVGEQIGVADQTTAAGMTEGPLQVDRLLLPLPAQLSQQPLQLGQFLTPVVGISQRFGFRSSRPARSRGGFEGRSRR